MWKYIKNLLHENVIKTGALEFNTKDGIKTSIQGCGEKPPTAAGSSLQYLFITSRGSTEAVTVCAVSVMMYQIHQNIDLEKLTK